MFTPMSFECNNTVPRIKNLNREKVSIIYYGGLFNIERLQAKRYEYQNTADFVFLVS